MDKAQRELIEIYTKAQQEIFRKVQAEVGRGSASNYQRALLKAVNETLAELQGESIKWVEKNMGSEYTKAVRKAQANLREQYNVNSIKDIPNYENNYEKFTRINRRAVEALINEKIAQLSIANASLNKSVRNIIKQKIVTGETIRDTQKRIMEQLFGASRGATININGQNWDIRKYAELVARTSTREATNTANKNLTDSIDSNILRMSSHAGSCPICLPLQGRWYTTNPDDKRFPYIYGTGMPWGNGYNTVHPNCRHVFNPVVLELEGAEEIARMIKKSNASFEIDKKMEQQLKSYFAEQKAKSQLWNDTQQYERYVARMGRENVGTLSSFRRVKNAGSDRYYELVDEYRAYGIENKKAFEEHTNNN